MKMMLLMLATMIAQDPVPSFDARWAQQVGGVGTVRLNSVAKNMVVTPEGVLPIGFTVAVEGQSLVFGLDATATLPGVYDATLTVTGQYKPIENWKGPWVEGQDTLNIQWIVFDPGLADFFTGSPSMGDQLVSSQL